LLSTISWRRALKSIRARLIRDGAEMKGFTDLFIRRPVLAIVVNVLILVGGLQAINSLVVRQYTKSENASVKITTVYIGANAELVRGFITAPLERAIAAADGIEYLQSQSAQGLSTITARLKLNYDATKALAEISSKVDQVRGDLPPSAEVPIINIEPADSQFAAAYLSFSSELLEQNQITDYLVRVIQPRLAAVEGVQRAELLGGRTFAMRLWMKPERMAALGVTSADLRQALARNNYLAAVGRTKGSYVQVNLTTNTDLRSVDEFKQLVIRQEAGGLVRIQDVADVVLGAEDYDTEVRFSGETAVFMGVWVLPNSNSVDVIRAVRQEMEKIQTELPSAMNAKVAYDATAYIQDALDEVIKTLLETLLIVVIVIFLFLGSLRSALVPVVAIPISLIGAVFLMQIFGFTINLLTLLAVVLSVGLVVDDAVVVVENVERRMREGLPAIKAAMIGARELVGPIIAMTITLAAVYAPIGLQGGLTGALFREFAFTLAGAVTISGIVALTLSPLMSYKLIKQESLGKGFSGKIQRDFERLKELYGRILDKTLTMRPAVYAVWVGLALFCVPMFMMSAKELAPTEDQGVIFAILESPANATIDQVMPHADQVDKIFRSIPETQFTFQLTYPSGGFGGAGLKPWGERSRTAFELMPEVSQHLAQVSGLRVLPLMPPALPGGGDFPVEVVIASTAEPERILQYAEALQQKAAASGMFAFPPLIDTKIDQPQTEIVIDRDKVASMGLSLEEVGANIAGVVGGDFVNRFNISGRSYKVIPQIKRSARLAPEQLTELYINGSGGQLIPLSTVARLENSTQPRSLNRFQQLNAVKISGVAIVPLDQALQFFETEARAVLPDGYTLDYTGESRQLRTEGDKFLPAMMLAVLLIFLVLAAQFNSFRDPMVILAGSVPLAMFGALMMTFLKIPAPDVPFWTNGWTTTLNIYSQVGLVTLVGLVSKNGILIVEFANELQRQGLSKLDAVRQAARTRLRPVLMTSVATVAGHFPLTLVTGAGAEARNSIGLVLVAGMAIGTLLTLFVVPSLYVLMAKAHVGERAKDLELEPEEYAEPVVV
jgi:multidrug efflux pump